MNEKRGTVHLSRLNFRDGSFAIGVSIPAIISNDGEGNKQTEMANIRTKAFRRFMNQCVGSPNMTIFTSKDLRDKRYNTGKHILLRAGYEVNDV